MRKKVLAVVVGGLLGAGVGFALGNGPLLRYKSEGVLNVEIGTAEYKRIGALVNDGDAVQYFAKISPPLGVSESDGRNLVGQVTGGGWHKPVPRISRADSKDLPDFLLQLEQERERVKDEPNGTERMKMPPTVYLGVRLEGLASNPDAAANVAKWLGAYFKDMAAREAVRELVARWAAESYHYSDRSEERKLRYLFDIEQAQARAAGLKSIVSAYPDAGRREASQVVDVRRDNEKFMSPMAQLVGAESEIIDIRNKLKRLEREAKQQNFVKDMVASAKAITAETRSGSESVSKLSAVIAAFSKKVSSEAEGEKLASMAAGISQISARFLSQAEFVTQPAVPDRPESPTPLMLTILGALLAAALVAIVAWRDELLDILFFSGRRDRV